MGLVIPFLKIEFGSRNASFWYDLSEGIREGEEERVIFKLKKMKALLARTVILCIRKSVEETSKYETGPAVFVVCGTISAEVRWLHCLGAVSTTRLSIEGGANACC